MTHRFYIITCIGSRRGCHMEFITSSHRRITTESPRVLLQLSATCSEKLYSIQKSISQKMWVGWLGDNEVIIQPMFPSLTDYWETQKVTRWDGPRRNSSEEGIAHLDWARAGTEHTCKMHKQVDSTPCHPSLLHLYFSFSSHLWLSATWEGPLWLPDRGEKWLSSAIGGWLIMWVPTKSDHEKQLYE